jgi:hypothetical protein
MSDAQNDEEDDELHIEGHKMRKGPWTKPIREWLGWE